MQKLICTKGVLKNFAKLTEKYLCRGFFFNQVAGHRLRDRLRRMCFPVNFAKFVRAPIFIGLYRRLSHISTKC